MDIEITARRVQLSKKFKDEANAKLGKITKIAPDAQSAHVVVTAQPNPSMSPDSRKVEITVFAGKDCIRADAASNQDSAAFDEALDKLIERTRRFRGKRRQGRGEIRQNLTPSPASLSSSHPLPPSPDSKSPTQSAALAPSPSPSPQALKSDPKEPEEKEEEGKKDEAHEELIEAHLGDAVFEVRRKIFKAQPIDIDEAIYEMELLGHDFFLFIDKETGHPSALYRRHGMSYGVLELEN